MSKPWDNAQWAVDAEDGAIVEIETSSSQTWALRALIAAGQSGFRPAGDTREHWVEMAARLRELGFVIDDLPPDSTGLPGHRLEAKVVRVT